MVTNWDQVHTDVIEWIKEAGNKITESFTHTLQIQTKSDRNDLVTNIDKQIEQFFIKKIREKYPEHLILGEEGYGENVHNTEGTIWIIDPIDGTVNFVHQQRNFSISIGIYENGIGKLGYIYDVVHKELYHVIAGSGAYFNGNRLPKLQEPQLSDAIVGINATWLISNKHVPVENLHKLVRDVRSTRSLGSAALEMAYIATGRFDAYIAMRLSPWDFAAGKMLVEELGGSITTVKGEPLNILEGSTVFVSKPGLHQKILRDYLLK
ncbi:inositol monophosphatase family protein [Margalitia shackletonii]|uniref:inositol monophosphatase family protein n=1 Tax=Heyndrickxia TaxID=2837504 RepID=UPI00190FCBCE